MINEHLYGFQLELVKHECERKDYHHMHIYPCDDYCADFVAPVPDFQGNAEWVEKVSKSGLDVFAHNIETVEELQSAVRDHRANFKQSLDFAPTGTLTKTSIILGCGETPDQIVKAMEKVRVAGVDVMTFGQYMRPSKRHMPVSEYITHEAFEKYQTLGMEMGFRYVASGPMVRSSYKAGEFYIKSMIESDRAASSSKLSTC
ncbi:lipoyl synthase 1, mitochondrial-like [Vicia villosa]|uniref:lipoyl synthase 1, mitochondrial-like n=1 Tax=Vicia villosa TaxID=3911 RepID=UPI00273BD554|nr:lipoyl synthase 1, mitochondrial-like [Vicia villosa]